MLDDMAAQGYITPAQGAAAKATKLRVYARPIATTKNPAAYFVDYVTRKLVDRYGARETFEGGLRVYTSLDMHMQNAASPPSRPSCQRGYAGALAAVDPANGFIRAMAASTDYRTYKWNLTSQAMRQPGLTMKPFALLAAVEEGADPAVDLLQLAPAAHLPGSRSQPSRPGTSSPPSTPRAAA